MIPTVLLAAVVVGRWWMLPVCAVAWVAILIAVGAVDPALQDAGEMWLAAGLAAANAAVGVALHRLVVATFRQIRDRLR